MRRKRPNRVAFLFTNLRMHLLRLTYRRRNLQNPLSHHGRQSLHHQSTKGYVYR